MAADLAFDVLDKKDTLQDNDPARAAGRPRSENSRKAILESTRRLLTRTPLSALSIEAIAKRAGVGKTTIYRWWNSKAAVAMEAFLEQPGMNSATQLPDDIMTPAEGVEQHLINLVRLLRGQNGRIIAGIIAESQSDASVLDLLYERFLKDRVGALYRHIEEGKRDGSFKTDVETDIAVDMVLGPLFLRVLSGEHGIDARFAETYPQQACRMLA